jgi:hydroxyethylthiazole kinase-like uncharacterized protein yjeF
MSISIYDKPRAYDVFTAENISTWERKWIKDTAGFKLMRQAGLMLSEAILDIMYAKGLYQAKILVCCGMGNNGGDGYLVANHLAKQGHTVTVFAPDAPKTADSQAARGLSYVLIVDSMPDDEFDVYIDALFGNGLNKDLPLLYQNIIHALNAKRGLKLAIDVPSGLHPDKGEPLPCAFHADFTLSVMGLRLGFFMGQGRNYTGQVVHLPLIPAMVYPVATLDTRPPRFKRSDIYAHKGTHGHALIIGGHRQMGGAVIMAGETAIYGGAGKVTVMCHKSHHQAILARCPAVMVRDIDDLTDFDELLGSVDSVAFGMGLGRDDWAGGRFDEIWQSLTGFTGFTVLDADALYFVAECQAKLLDNQLGTPHTGEAVRLLGKEISDRAQMINALQAQYGGNWLLKGANSLVFDKANFDTKGLEICAFGNASMATAGMGDVLSGVIAGLKARFGSEVSIMDCVSLHALVGDKLGKQGSGRIVASDMPRAVLEMLEELTI